MGASKEFKRTFSALFETIRSGSEIPGIVKGGTKGGYQVAFNEGHVGVIPGSLAERSKVLPIKGMKVRIRCIRYDEYFDTFAFDLVDNAVVSP